MRRTLTAAIVLALVAAFAGAAHAQQYKWIDQNGKVVYGDAPPPGVKATPLRPPPAPVAAPPAAAKGPAGKDAAAKDVKKGPLTPAEQEQEYRKRQQEADKAREKTELEAKAAAEGRDNCARAQEMQRTLASGQRIQRTDSKGERYYLDEAASAQETAKAQALVEQWCK